MNDNKIIIFFIQVFEYMRNRFNAWVDIKPESQLFVIFIPINKYYYQNDYCNFMLFIIRNLKLNIKLILNFQECTTNNFH